MDKEISVRHWQRRVRAGLERMLSIFMSICVMIGFADDLGHAVQPTDSYHFNSTAATDETAIVSSIGKIKVRQIVVIGSTVFSASDFSEVTTSYVERGELTVEDLEDLRLALTRYYVDRGYVTSGAVLRNQTVKDGTLMYEIIEGKITHIEVENHKWFRPTYIRKRLELGAQSPVNIQSLQESLLLLEKDSRIERVNVDLQPGLNKGESSLKARISETLPFYVSLGFDNYQSPSVGAERGNVTLAHRNLTGQGDILSVTYGRSAGLDLKIDASYMLPLNIYNTTLRLEYRRNETIVVEAPFEDLDIESESEVFSLTLRHPLYRTLNQEFAISLSGERLSNQTRLLGSPFDFSSGSPNGDGKTTDVALRLTMEWSNRTQNQVFAVRSRFNLGVDVLGATMNDAIAIDDVTFDIPDGRFFAWLGQFQWARRIDLLGMQNIQILSRIDIQLANDPLLPLEQMAVGGRFSVRGYRENQLIRDNGIIVSVESRLPLWQKRSWADFLELVPFFDFGHAYNTGQSTPDLKTIYSVGIGLRWTLSFLKPIPCSSQFEIYWGYPLTNIPNTSGNLQDQGIHLQLVITTL